ncbi:MAG TPA: hypothetical protein VI911_00160 [Patescibacteria group bacterium]|nr:hypothetical protein [Patescibacteria group bacterium]
MARIDIDIEEYLDEVNTKYLVRECLRRHDFEKIMEEERKTETVGFLENPDKMILPEFKTSDQLLSYIKRLLGLRPWHDKKRIITEIENL